jgi:uncharacterized protein involved in exopolysaccharide biosynthesis
LPKGLSRKTGAIAGVAIATVAGGSLLNSGVEPSPQYEGRFQLRVGTETRNGTEQAAKPAQATTTTADVDYATHARILWSHNVLAPVAEQLQSRYPDLDYRKLSGNLEVAYDERTNQFEVNYRDTDPEKVQVVLDRISRAYLKYSQECHSDICQVLEFIDQRLPQLQSEVKTQTQQIQEFQHRYGVSNPNELGQELSRRKGVLEKQSLDFQIELSAARTRYVALQKEFGTSPQNDLADRLLASDRRYQEVLSQLQSLANQFATELAHPQANQVTVEAFKQQYQQVSLELAEVVQQVVLKSQLGKRATSPAATYEDTLQVYILGQWVDTVRQIHTLETSSQLTEDAKKLLSVQVRQWAVLARQYEKLQQSLHSSTELLNLNLSRRADLQARLRPPQPWRMVAPPEVVQVSGKQASPYLINAEQDLRLGLALCFALLIWGISLTGTATPRSTVSHESEPNVVPEYSWEVLPVLPVAPAIVGALPAFPVSYNGMQWSPTWKFEGDPQAIAYFLLFALVYLEKAKTEEWNGRTLDVGKGVNHRSYSSNTMLLGELAYQ